MKSLLDEAFETVLSVVACVDRQRPSASLSERRDAFIASKLIAQIADATDPGTRDECFRLLNDLTSEQVKGLLRAPGVCESLRRRLGAGHLNQTIRQTLGSEVARRTEESAAVGILACGVPLDLSLPPALTCPSSGLVEPRFLTSGEMREAVHRINRGVNILAAVSTTALSLFCDLTSNIVLRADDVRTEESWGASSAIAIGRIVIVNGQRELCDHVMGDLILHETVHGMLSCIDLVHPLAGSDPALYRLTFPSPWSGNQLHLNALIHATLVWALLAAFWRSLIDDPTVGATAQERAHAAQRGFLTDQYKNTMERVSGVVPSTTTQLIVAAESIVIE